VDVRNLRPLGVNSHKQGGALLAVGTVPALAEGTTSFEPTGKAKSATTAKSEVLVPWAQDNARRGCEVETPPREGKCMHEPPPGHCHRRASANQRCPTKTKCVRGLDTQPPEGRCKPEVPSQKGEYNIDVLLQDGKHEHKVLPQGSLNEGEVEPDLALQVSLHKAILSLTTGIVTCLQETWPPQMSQKVAPPAKDQPCTWDPSTITPICCPELLPSRSQFIFILMPIQGAWPHPGECKHEQ
jgi:hypothetical protein